MLKKTKISLFTMLATFSGYTLAGDSYCFMNPSDSDFGILNGHRHNYSMPNKYSASNLKIGTRCGESIPSNWIYAIKDATSKLNSSGANINITWIDNSCSTNIDIKVSVEDLPLDVPGQANYGSSSGIGNFIYIGDWYAWLGIPTSSSFKKHVALHEIMHTLGFMHTSSTMGYEVSGTDNISDVLSDKPSVVFAKIDLNNPVNGLSSLDKKALKTFYPK